MPNYIAGVLLALGLALPVGMAAIATLWQRESLTGTPLWGKIMMVVLFIAAAVYFVGIAVYGNSRYHGWDLNSLYPYYWFLGVGGVITGTAMLGNAYSGQSRRT